MDGHIENLRESDLEERLGKETRAGLRLGAGWHDAYTTTLAALLYASDPACFAYLLVTALLARIAGVHRRYRTPWWGVRPRDGAGDAIGEAADNVRALELECEGGVEGRRLLDVGRRVSDFTHSVLWLAALPSVAIGMRSRP